jgi:asparagine synthase (glutamine-hydrolysing)
MCGLAGVLDVARASDAGELERVVRAMASTLRHRGPDDSGSWIDARSGVALGHRRLAVIDVSPAGHQPMTSRDGRYVLVFNGEIYNFAELGEELAGKGHEFRGHSDTEVLLAAILEWGIQGAVERSNGMFAFAVWDRHDERLHLVRDRLGEKPVYFGTMGGFFLFGSELKALRAHPAFRAEIDRDALTLYLRHNCVPAPWSIYRDVRKLPPGCIATVDRSRPGEARLARYWSAVDVAVAGAADPARVSETDAVDAVEELLADSVRRRMEADVPLGAFLSGGVDSSTVVALMQEHARTPVRTFTIGTTSSTFDEAHEARAVARHLGTDHTELLVTPSEAMDVIPRLPVLYDEPFADSSQIPTFLVSELARRHVTVSLSGDGGDDVFGGYNRYQAIPALWRRVGWLPTPVRRGLAGALRAVPPRAWDSVVRPVPARVRPRIPAVKAAKIAEILEMDDVGAAYVRLTSHWSHPLDVVRDAHEPATVLTDRSTWPDFADMTTLMLCLDSITYLPDDVLVKLDRASMAVSLEARVPLLDHRLVELAARLPAELKFRRPGKWVLRQVLYRHVPRQLVDRPKAGFGVPLGAWLRGPLRPWAEELLDGHRLEQEGYFDPRPIRAAWTEHVSGQRDWEYHLWDVLMFQAWLEDHARTPAGSVHAVSGA